LVLALLVFAGINGSVDVRRSSAFRTLNNQVNGLGVEIDTVRTDVSTLQGDLDGLRQRVEVLSGLTARMDKAESTIGAFGEDIDTLQTAVSAMTQEIDDLGQAVDTLELQSAQTLSFFEQLRALLEEMFGGKEPQGAIPSPEGVN
jgi:predicted  nucleic acid-binding Zn-ribbon protein